MSLSLLKHLTMFFGLDRRRHIVFGLLSLWLCSTGCDRSSKASLPSPEGGSSSKVEVASRDPSKPQSSLGKKKSAPALGKPTSQSGRRKIADGKPSSAAVQRLHQFHQRDARRGSLPSENQEPIDLLLSRYSSSLDPLEQIGVIQALKERGDDRSLAFLAREALHAKSPELRAAAIEALAESPRDEHVQVAATAMSSTDPDVQASGVWLLGKLRTEASIPLWQQAITGPSPDLGLLAFDRLTQAPESIQVGVARNTVGSSEPWIVEQSLVILGGVHSKPSVEALIPSIDHPQSGDLAQDGLMFLLGQYFEDSAAARQWWQANQAGLGADLQPLEVAPVRN
jgi:HEAT repeat protein